ncbi:MAG: hypothetical protein JW776_02570 [Candidatus Lokiarchaeota archaeon]|nr:hypothetical protein [Candidatus Lokiarchaeota archaeon]
MDFNVYRLSDDRIIQIASKEKMKKWTGEVPLVYINYIRDSHLKNYGSKKDQKEISDYLDEAMEEIAVPKLIAALESHNDDEVMAVLTRIEELSRKDPDLVKITLSNVERKQHHPNKDISKLAEKIQKNYDRAMKRRQIKKQLEDNEKIGGTDAELDQKLIRGDISENEYLRLKKERIEAYQELQE